MSYGWLLLLLLLALSWLVFRNNSPREKPTLRSVAVLVLGDIGRSPRMMYHVESLSRAQFQAFFIGYKGSKEVPSLRSLPNVHFLYLSEPPPVLSALPFVLLAPFKIAHQIFTILVALLFRISHPPEFILVQNPPSIPTLALVWMVGRIKGSKVIIDWHNLGYSILALKLGKGHIFVRLAEKFERRFGRSAYAHLFVSQAMHDYLVEYWDLQGHKAILHDRPPHHFHKASPPEVHELFLRLREPLPPTLYTDFFPKSAPPYSTPFTYIQTANLAKAATTGQASMPFQSLSSPTYSRLNLPALRTDRPALLVSSTSWTPDEDFSILLEALCSYEKRARQINAKDEEGKRLPKILVILTGKGPLKDKYMNDVNVLQNGVNGGDGAWEWVRCISMWLEAEDYPLLLGSADLGICFHSSSSGLDLPMKVVDMFGCGLPVCALDFPCLDELVKHGQNGLVFKNAAQLADQFQDLLTSFPNSKPLATLRSSLTTASQDVDGRWEWNTWEANWGKIVRPLILSDVSRP